MLSHQIYCLISPLYAGPVATLWHRIEKWKKKINYVFLVVRLYSFSSDFSTNADWIRIEEQGKKSGNKKMCVFKLITWLRWICFLAAQSGFWPFAALCTARIHTSAIITGNLFDTQTNKTNRIDFRLDRVSRHRLTKHVQELWNDDVDVVADDDDVRRWIMPTARKTHTLHTCVNLRLNHAKATREKRSREKWLKTIYRQPQYHAAPHTLAAYELLEYKTWNGIQIKWMALATPSTCIFSEKRRTNYNFDGNVQSTLRTMHENIYVSGVCVNC